MHLYIFLIFSFVDCNDALVILITFMTAEFLELMLNGVKNVHMCIVHRPIG